MKKRFAAVLVIALKVDWDGLRYQVTCKSSTGSAGASATVTYNPKCELPLGAMGVWWSWDHALVPQPADNLPGTGGTLSMRDGVRGAGRQWMTRQDDFSITSVKTIGEK